MAEARIDLRVRIDWKAAKELLPSLTWALERSLLDAREAASVLLDETLRVEVEEVEEKEKED